MKTRAEREKGGCRVWGEQKIAVRRYSSKKKTRRDFPSEERSQEGGKKSHFRNTKTIWSLEGKIHEIQYVVSTWLGDRFIKNGEHTFFSRKIILCAVELDGRINRISINLDFIRIFDFWILRWMQSLRGSRAPMKITGLRRCAYPSCIRATINASSLHRRI